MPEKTQRPALTLLVALVVAGVAALPFLPALDNDFVWDDRLNVHGDPQVADAGPGSVREIFTSSHAGHYAPLSRLSLALNALASGSPESSEAGARPYIAVNILLHALNAGLVFLLFRRLLPGGKDWSRPVWAALGALLYALHPLRVESVVWVTERRDVLALFFLLLTLLLWLMAQDRKSRLLYGLALLAYGLSLLSKAWGIVLPVILLVLCWQPLRRKDWSQCLLGLVPFAILAAIFAIVAGRAQSEEAMASLAAHGVIDRLVQAAWAPAFYAWKTLLPLDLSPLYLLRFDYSPWSPVMLAGAAFTIAVTIALLLMVKRHPGWLAAWLIYLAVIAPVSGIAQSGSQLAADRYTYLAGMVAAFAVAWAGRWACACWPKHSLLLCLGVTVAIVALSPATVKQTRIWKTDESLWTQAIAVEPDHYVAYFNRATTGSRQPLEDLGRAIKANPRYAKAYAERGKVYLNKGQFDAARADIETAIGLNIQIAGPFNNRAIIRMNDGNLEGALADFNEAISRQPSLYEAYVNRGLTHQRMGNYDAALADYTQALALVDDSWQVYFNRGLLYQNLGYDESALADFNKVVALRPQFAEGWMRRAEVHRALGNRSEAISDMEMGLRVQQEITAQRPADKR